MNASATSTSELTKSAVTIKSVVTRLQEFSIPLIAGVVVALACANLCPSVYDGLVHTPLHQIATVFDNSHAVDPSHPAPHAESHAIESPQDVHHHTANDNDGHHAESPAVHVAGHDTAHGWQHFLTLHFLVNDIFMVFFFGLAAKEITEACLPGGALNPVSKAINPLLGTLGGVLGPIGVYFIANTVMGQSEWSGGWGIPTATDIALAWLVARCIFGARHPAVSFLLLLAVADDAIGLGIIAVAYPDPNHAPVWMNTLWIVPAMAIAFGLRKMKVQSWVPYIFVCGAISWWGLYTAHLHPALALVFIVPFLPGPKRDLGLFAEESGAKHHGHSSLESYEHRTKLYVDFGLFFFAFVNAGVAFSGVTNLTWVVLVSLIAGKTLGITAFSYGGHLCGCKLPDGMRLPQLLVTAMIAGVGLTVALFVSGQAFTAPDYIAAAKMGALFSVGAAGLAWMMSLALLRETSEAKEHLAAEMVRRHLEHQAQLLQNAVTGMKHDPS